MHTVKHKTFFELSGTQRRRQYINIKNKISTRKGRLFYTDLYMDDDEYTLDPDNPYDYHPRSQKSAWLDLYFLSKKHRFYYNACFITRDMAVIDVVDDYISEEADKRCTFEFPPVSEWFTCKPSKYGTSISRNPNYKDYFEEHDSLSEIIKEEVFNEKTINIRTDVRMDYTYASGVGLYATLDTDDLTIDVVNKWIQDFWDSGERITNGIVIPYQGDDIRKLYTKDYFKKQL